ncbi:hypothetical protein [Kitasatospora aureofaciens]|uniref:hypothetical protein n=1 Tax=Kitasatospora aureofaciens TaxID=1894 RepID=UPI001C466A8B|nr:hypothetical protein [Kitasatospora aureofaciens]MBV6702825.1 hypothetical protein [Kitasatospora aureofaciens]
MLPRTVRGVVEAAAVVVEEVGKRVVGTAATILERTGVDVAEVERRLGEKFPPSAKTLQTLAEEAVTAGRAGVDLAVGAARGEVEKVFEKVGDQVTKVGVVLAYLESKLREVEEGGVPAAQPGPAEEVEEPAPAPRADDLFGRGWEQEEPPAARTVGEPIVAERVEVDEPVEVDPPVAPAKSAARTPAKKAPAKKTSVASTAGTGTAKKAAAKTAAVKKTAAEKTVAKKTAARTAVKKTASTKKTATTKKTAAAAEVPAKRTATKKATVRKATSTKKPDA